MFIYQRDYLNIMNFIFNVNKNQTIKKFSLGEGQNSVHHLTTCLNSTQKKLPIPGLRRKLKTHTIVKNFLQLRSI